MAKKLAIALAIVMAIIVVWGLSLESNVVTVIVNGQQVTGPMNGAIGVGGLVVAAIALFCAATFLVFVFAGVGLVILGFFVFFGVIMVGFLFPFFWPVLAPLLIVWAFIAIAQGKKT